MRGADWGCGRGAGHGFARKRAPPARGFSAEERLPTSCSLLLPVFFCGEGVDKGGPALRGLCLRFDRTVRRRPLLLRKAGKRESERMWRRERTGVVAGVSLSLSLPGILVVLRYYPWCKKAAWIARVDFFYSSSCLPFSVIKRTNY